MAWTDLGRGSGAAGGVLDEDSVESVDGIWAGIEHPERADLGVRRPLCLGSPPDKADVTLIQELLKKVPASWLRILSPEELQHEGKGCCPGKHGARLREDPESSQSWWDSGWGKGGELMLQERGEEGESPGILRIRCPDVCQALQLGGWHGQHVM